MHKRRVKFESLESRQLLNAAPIDASNASVSIEDSAAQSGFVRYVRNGDLILNSNSSQPTTESTPQHWPTEQVRSKWTPKFAADFNGDGLTDIIGEVANDNADSANSWLQANDGEQFFLLPWGDGLPVDTDIVGSGDVDGDGLKDIISFDASTNEVWVSINSLDSGFHNQLWTRFSTPIDTDLFVGDFDQDGLTDVLAGDRTGSWLLGKSTGSRFANQYWGRFVDYGWQDLVIGDFNGDSLSDIAGRAPDQTWWIWSGSKTGLERAAYAGHWKMEASWYDVQVADFNADGMDDVIGRTGEGMLFVGTSMPSDGQPSFRTWRWTKGWIFSADWRNVTIVDITGDGLPDQIGQAKDGTWWLAENIGTNFKNTFFDRHRNVDFVATLANASDDSEAAATVLQQIPTTDESSSLSAQKTELTEQLHQPLRVSINANDELVLRGKGQQLRAVEFQSPSGSLVPLQQIGANFGFNQLGSNDAVNVRLSTSSSVTIDGELILGVRWDRSTGMQDLLVNYDLVDLPAVVEDEVFANSQTTFDPNISNSEAYAELFANTVTWPIVLPKEEPTITASTVEPDPQQEESTQASSETADQPVLVEPVEPIPSEQEAIEPQPELVETDEPVAGGSVLAEPPPDTSVEKPADAANTTEPEVAEESVGTEPAEIETPKPETAPEPAVDPENAVVIDNDPESEFQRKESGALALSFDEENKFEIAPTDALVYALRIESPTHSLLLGDSPAPFDEILVQDSGLVVYAANEPISFAEATQLDLGWTSEQATDQLIAEFANSLTDWLPVELFGTRLSESKTTEPPTLEPAEQNELSVTLDADNYFVVTSDQQNVLGMNFVSKSGGLIPGTSPKPFEIFVSNTPKQVTLGTWGTLVSISGSVTLDVGWNNEVADDLQVEYGDEVAAVHVIEVIIPLSDPLSTRPQRN